MSYFQVIFKLFPSQPGYTPNILHHLLLAYLTKNADFSILWIISKYASSERSATYSAAERTSDPQV